MAELFYFALTGGFCLVCILYARSLDRMAS